MKTYFHRITCPHCGKVNDSKRTHCENCKDDLNNLGARKFENHIVVPFWKEIVFFLIALVGLSLVATIIQYTQLAMVMGQNPDMTRGEAAAIVVDVNGGYLTFMEFAAYITVFVAGGLLLWSAWKEIGKSFVDWKPYAMGMAGLAIIIAVQLGYNMLTELILKAAGIEPGSNANQGAIVSITKASPFMSLFVFGLIGPFVEELAYRVGLFGLLTRVNKIVGYIGALLVFGLIHFDFEAGFNFAEVGACVNEWISLPIYMFSGAVFCFLYDRFGFGASYVCHAANNIFSLSTIILANTGGSGA